MSDVRSSAAGEFRVGLVQMACTAAVGDNHAAAAAGIREAARRGAQIICLQELFATRYFCQTEDAACFDLAEPIPGPSTERYARLAAELQVVLIVPLFERRAAGLYHNAAVVLDADGSVSGIYRKTHIPDDPQYLEKFYFTPGDLGYGVFETRFARVGVLICWDQWYPEAARLTALGGAELLVCPTAIGWVPADRGDGGLAQCDAWRIVQQGHAIANGVYLAAVNRVGREESPAGGLEFWGRSFVCDPQGRMLAEGTAHGPEVIVAACSRRRIEDLRRDWPFLRDRRIDTYGPLTRRYLDEAPGRDPAE